MKEFLDPFAAFLSQAGFAAVLRPACLDSSTLNQRIRKDPPGRNVRAGASG